MARKALLVGINLYPEPANRLRGCVNDVRQTAQMLAEHYGFERAANVRLLTDRQATTAAIRAGLAWLLAGAVPGDLLVFQYSGHGSQVPDQNGDEADGLDEIICPYDLDWDRPFTDDDLGEIVSGLPQGVNLTVILDCCHAGTGLRLPAGERWRPRCLAPPAGVKAATSGVLPVRRFGKSASERGAILIAACSASQVSADAFIANDYHGALTWYLWIAAANGWRETSYSQLGRRVRQLVREAGFDQVPQVEADRRLLGKLAFVPFALAAV